jgi:hypothetical protein
MTRPELDSTSIVGSVHTGLNSDAGSVQREASAG